MKKPVAPDITMLSFESSDSDSKTDLWLSMWWIDFVRAAKSGVSFSRAEGEI